VTDALAIALTVAAAPTLLALGSFMQSLRNGKKTDALVVKTDEIHVLANANLAKVTEALNIANQRIAGLERMIGELGKDKTLAAAAVVSTAATLAAATNVQHKP